MPYTAAIDRVNPSAFFFIIDQSGSMDEKMEEGDTKSRFLADVLNKTLYQLGIRCSRLILFPHVRAAPPVVAR